MRQLSVRNMKNETVQVEKTATVLVRKIRDAILDDFFKPGDWLPEVDLAKRFEVSRSPIREALQALEKEGTVAMEPYKGAIVKPLSAEETLDIAEIRLPLITLAAKAAYRHLSPADFDLAHGLAKQATRATASKNSLNTIGAFGPLYSRKRNGPFYGKCSHAWTTD